MPTKVTYFYLLCYFLPVVVSAQTPIPNDNMADRLLLKLNQPHTSRTDGCTLEYACLNTKLTGKCIKYHNDQWFSFNSGEHTEIFLNVSGQNCRDLRGVQVVVLKGEACQPETYQLLTCVSLANQNDIFIALDSLEPQSEYFVNVDGYLEDYCQFTITLSQEPQGFPLKLSPNFLEGNPVKARREQAKIYMEWILPESLKREIKSFEVYRRIGRDQKSRLKERIAVTRNAYGEFPTDFSFEDSITSIGQKYVYQVLTTDTSGRKHLILEETFMLETIYELYHRKLVIPLEKVRRPTPKRITVKDAESKQILMTQAFEQLRKQKNYTLFTHNLMSAYHPPSTLLIEVKDPQGKITSHRINLRIQTSTK